MTNNGATYLEPLVNLWNGLDRSADQADVWPAIAVTVSRSLDGQVQAALCSPTGRHLALCIAAKNWFGLKVRYAGLIYAVRERLAVGRIVLGKRELEGWRFERSKQCS